MTINSLYPELQSSYHQHHSTETALLKMMNDVLLNMNSQQVTLKVLLDLNVTFDTESRHSVGDGQLCIFSISFYRYFLQFIIVVVLFYIF